MKRQSSIVAASNGSHISVPGKVVYHSEPDQIVAVRDAAKPGSGLKVGFGDRHRVRRDEPGLRGRDA